VGQKINKISALVVTAYFLMQSGSDCARKALEIEERFSRN